MKECKVIRGGAGFHGKQGLDYFAGVSAESASSEAICMHMLVMPPGAEAKPHYHEAHETAIYMLEGSTSFRHGQNLEHLDTVNEGDLSTFPRECRTSRSTRPTKSRAPSLLAPIRTNRKVSCLSDF